MAGSPRVAVTEPLYAPVHINVGGTSYTTTLETLTKFPESRLANLFNGTEAIVLDPMKHHYFLDRDGLMFRHILNFLRNNELSLPTGFDEFHLLKKEASFFKIEALCHALNTITAKEEEELNEVKLIKESEHEKEATKKKEKKQELKERMDEQENNSVIGVGTNTHANMDLNNETQINDLLIHQNSCLTQGLLDEGNSIRDNSNDASSDLVCVISNEYGAVVELWSSVDEFSVNILSCAIKLQNTVLGKYVLTEEGSDILMFRGRKVCKRCIRVGRVSERGICHQCRNFLREDYTNTYSRTRVSLCDSRVNIQIAWMAKSLFKIGFKLVSSSSADVEVRTPTNSLVDGFLLYNYFVK